jgi:hypothetical protein
MCDHEGAPRSEGPAGAGNGQPLGRWLTAERVRELNSRSWFYAMLKDNPQLTGIYPGIEDDILAGAVDHHIHAYPDFVHRSQDMYSTQYNIGPVR